MFTKQFKCTFCESQVEYLRDILSAEGVVIDLMKIKAMRDFSIPKTIKELRGIMGLPCYYWKFIGWFGILSSPLTNLFKISLTSIRIHKKLLKDLKQPFVIHQY